MNEVELNEIENRCNAATPGPWTWEDWQEDGGLNKFTLTAPPETRFGGPSDMFPNLRNHLITDQDKEIGNNNKEFIAHARTDIPKLIAALRESRRIAAEEGRGKK